MVLPMPTPTPSPRRRPFTSALAGVLSTISPIAAGVVVVAALPAMLAFAPPQPDPVPRRWQLEIEPGPLRVVSIDSAAAGSQRYFYMTYRVTNNTSEDVLFAPSFEMANDEGDLVRSGRDIPAEVTRKILALLDNPLLQDQIGVLGMLLQGPANAKDGLVIWPARSLKADTISVYAGGFSGETRAVEVKDARTNEPKRVLLRKQLMIKYFMPGDITLQGNRPLDAIERNWILR